MSQIISMCETYMQNQYLVVHLEIFHAIRWLLVSTGHRTMEYNNNLQQTFAKQNWFGTFQREGHSKTQELFLFKKVGNTDSMNRNLIRMHAFY